RSEAALREADQHKNDFLAALSHELRNPLAPIRTSLFILDHSDAFSEKERRECAIIDRQVTQLTRLVDGLLDVSRIAQGKIQLIREMVDAGELVRQTVEDYGATFQSTGLHLDAQIDPGPFWIDADPARISQIIGNLLGNSQKFTHRDGHVQVRVQSEGN